MLRRVLLPASAAAVGLAVKVSGPEEQKRSTLESCQAQAGDAIQRFLLRNGVPGLSVGVSVNGNHVWTQGYGFADVEQLVPCTGKTVMRIASISKCMTAIMAARLVQDGKLDLDAPIQKYLPNYPMKRSRGIPVNITSRQLLCHTSGIRAYKEEENKTDTRKDRDEKPREAFEFLSNKVYKTVEEALETFKNDDLVSRPGEKFHYTTYGYTVLSAVLEKAGEEAFTQQAQKFFKLLGMNNTRLDGNKEIIANRARYYYRDSGCKLRNSPEVDNSCKWGGGGFVSSVDDLLTFTDAVLYSFHSSRFPNQCIQKKPLLNATTLETFWKGEIWDPRSKYKYALGWHRSDEAENFGGVDSGAQHSGFWMHTGGAVGASSIILIKPQMHTAKPEGVCVAVLTNLESCPELTHLALEIATIFQRLVVHDRSSDVAQSTCKQEEIPEAVAVLNQNLPCIKTGG